jgi:hypothetical protein
LIAALCAFLPILTYGYIYLRANAPFVVYSARPAWIPQTMSFEDATNLIRGTFAGSGASLESNFEFNFDALMNRAPTIFEHLRQDWDFLLIGVSALALLAYFAVNWRLALLLAFCALPVVPFLLVWKVDVKPIIYQYALWFPLALGMAALLSFEPRKYGEIEPPRHPERQEEINDEHQESSFEEVSIPVGARHASPLQNRTLRTIAQSVIPVLGSAILLFIAAQQLAVNFSERDMSNDHRAEVLARDIAALPDNAVLLTVQWSPEMFVALETLERSGERTPTLFNTDLWNITFPTIFDITQNVYVGEYWRARMGLYDGAVWFAQENQIAYSGTHSEFLLQVRPVSDPRLPSEADSATIVNFSLDDNIYLYSYRLEAIDGGWWVTLYWQAQTVPAESFSVYTHLRVYGTMCQFDNSVRLLAQDDANAPVQNSYPTTLWSAGQIVKDTYFIPTPAEAIDRTQTGFVFGMTRPNGERLNEFCLAVEDVE